MKIRIFVIYLMVYLLGCITAKEDIFILPKNFKGYVLVIFDQKMSQKEEYYNGSRVYRIPSDGILRTKFSPEFNWKKFPKFYYETIAETNAIKFEDLSNYLSSKNLIIVTGGSMGKISKSSHHAGYVSFLEYFVGQKYDIELYRSEANKIDIIKQAE